jgi:hypothetical protein
MHERTGGLSALAVVAGKLESAGIAYALIGGAALAVHGVSRSTLDLDLLAVDPVCLTSLFWEPVQRQGVAVEIRRGDADDPLAGVVRLDSPKGRPTDLVVGRSAWQARALTRAGLRTRIGEVEIPVLRAADLVLLKLYAGGPQDAWDVAQILLAVDRDSLVHEVEGGLRDLPAAAAALWRRVVASAAL